MFRTSALVAAVLLWLVAIESHVTSAADAADITGKYNCKGQIADGTEYEGTVHIKKNGDSYSVEWSLGKFGQYSGIGIRTDKVLSVSWQSGDTTGVIVYQIDKDGKFNGKWTQNGGNGSIQNETLTPAK